MPICSRCKTQGHQRSWNACPLKPSNVPDPLHIIDQRDLSVEEITAICRAALANANHPLLRNTPVDWTGFEESANKLREIYVSGAQSLAVMEEDEQQDKENEVPEDDAVEEEHVDPSSFVEVQDTNEEEPLETVEIVIHEE